jgi:hypothetical protein
MQGELFPNQWEGLLRNLGRWQGSFNRLDASGQPLEEIPSQVSLKLIDPGTVLQINRYYDPVDGTLRDEKSFRITSLSRSVLFFADGTFSQGSLQLAPFAEFGAELGFIAGERRMRLVLLYDSEGQFSRITLIHEVRAGSGAVGGKALEVDDLLGEWTGEAIVLTPDLGRAERHPTRLTVTRTGERLTQHLTGAGVDFTSSARIEKSTLAFGEGERLVRVLLLPGGASCAVAARVAVGRPCLLEAGWLVEADHRLRLVRSYDAKGAFVSLTLVSEQRIAPG